MSEETDALSNRIRQLENQVADMQRLAQDTSDLFDIARANGLDKFLAGHGLVEFGGGVERLDTKGIQINTSATDVKAIYFGNGFQTDPSTKDRYGYLTGKASTTQANIGIKAANSSLFTTNLGYGIAYSDNTFGGWFEIGPVLQFQVLAADPSSPAEGQVWYNTALAKWRFYDGTNTNDFPAVGGGMTPPLFGFPFNPAVLAATGSYPSITISGSTTYSSVDDAIKIATNFTINSGQTLTAKANGLLIVCKKFTSAGTIDARGANGANGSGGGGGAGGSGTNAGGGAGGNSGANGTAGTAASALSLITGPSTANRDFLIALASGAYDTTKTVGLGGAGGAGGGAPSPPFAGGAGGNGGIAAGPAGTGSTGSAGGTAYTAGGNLIVLTAAAVLMHLYGAGGGGGGGAGGSGGGSLPGGGGGGSGGSPVTIICDEFDNTSGSILTSGGNGGNGESLANNGGGGGGGGGAGSIIVVCRKLTGQGTLTANAGTKGALGTGASPGFAGGDGGAGKIIVIGAS